jgi:hypothetical protein
MPIAHTRRALVAGAPVLAALALLAASPAQAAIDCDLNPTAPLCSRGDDPGGDSGGGGSDPAGSSVIVATQRDEVGPGQFLSTTANVDLGALKMYASTHTWTTNWFWGFQGCVEFDFMSAYGTVVSHSQKVCQGVDGTAIGMFDRMDSVQWHLAAYDASRTVAVRIIHSKL